MKMIIPIYPKSRSLSILLRIQLPRILLHPLPRTANSFHSESKEASSMSFDLSRSFPDVFGKSVSFDSLTAAFKSVNLTQPLVEQVLLNLKEPENAKKALMFFNWSSKAMHFDHQISSYCIIVQILVRAGLLIDARALLESAIRNRPPEAAHSSSKMVAEGLLNSYESILPGRRVFDLLVQTYAKMRMNTVAYDVSRCLGDRGIDLSLISYNTLMHVLQKSGQNDLAWKVFEYMLQRRVYPNQATIEMMVNVMRKEGTLVKMMSRLDKIHGKRCAPGVTVSSVLIFRIVEEGRLEEAIMLLKRMLQKNMVFDDVYYSIMIFAHYKTARIDLAYEVCDEMINRGLSPNAFTYTCFIGAHCAEGNIARACHLMQEMLDKGLKPYDETYNCMIVGLSRTGKINECLEYHEKMLKYSLLPSSFACYQMFSRLCEFGLVEKANIILTDLVNRGFIPNVDLFLKLIDGYAGALDTKQILKLYYEMEHKALVDVSVFALVVQTLCRCGKPNEAEKILRLAERKGLVSTGEVYDNLIRGYCLNNESDRALSLYDEMVAKKLVLNVEIFMILVKKYLDLKVSYANKTQRLVSRMG